MKLVNKTDRVSAWAEVVGHGRIDRFDVDQVGAKIRGAERRPDLLDHFAALSDIRSFELRDDVAAAGVVGGSRDDLLAEIVIEPTRHGRAQLVSRDRGAEQVRVAVPSDSV